jgi:long-subunit fatty acid transport protein
MILKSKIHVLTGAAAALTLFASSSAFPAGFEKATLWSGHYAAVGGAASSIVDDAQALFFNPAGLAQAKGLELSGNFSPTDSQFSGPIASTTQIGGAHQILPIFGAFASYQVTDKLGVGGGAYVSGGTQSEYEGVDFSSFSANYASLKPTLRGDLDVIEYSLGAGYELLPGLRLGLGWRILHVGAHLQSAAVTPTNTALIATDIDNLSATRYNGYRVGLQYSPEGAKWGLGAVWRTEVSFIAKGSVSGQIKPNSATPTLPLTGGDASVANTFPQEVSIGAFYDVGSSHTSRVLVEYTFAQYAKDRVLDLDGTITNTSIPFQTQLPDIVQSWHNQQNLRFGFDGMLTDRLALRAGYVLTSQVTPDAHARPTFPAPGLGHTFTLGTGTKLLNDALETDLAFEYSFDKGTGTNEFTQTGDFKAQALVAHLGVTYRF